MEIIVSLWKALIFSADDFPFYIWFGMSDETYI